MISRADLEKELVSLQSQLTVLKDQGNQVMGAIAAIQNLLRAETNGTENQA